MERPVVLNFDSPVDFLNNYFDYKFYHDSTFSLKAWAMKANVKFPRLKDVLKERTPIKSGYFENAQHLLEMCEEEYFYFLSLIRYFNAKKPSDKKMFTTLLDHLKEVYFSKDSHKIGKCFVSLESNAVEKEKIKSHIFKNHLCMTILSMVHLKGFSLRVEDIESMLIYKNAQVEVEEALELLKKYELIKVINGKINPQINEFFTRSDVKMLPVHEYYEDVSDLAKKAIEQDVTKREFQCFTFSLKEEDITELKDMIRRFRYKVCRLEKTQADFVYQVNFQAFPIAKTLKEQATEL